MVKEQIKPQIGQEFNQDQPSNGNELSRPGFSKFQLEMMEIDKKIEKLAQNKTQKLKRIVSLITQLRQIKEQQKKKLYFKLYYTVKTKPCNKYYIKKSQQVMMEKLIQEEEEYTCFEKDLSKKRQYNSSFPLGKIVSKPKYLQNKYDQIEKNPKQNKKINQFLNDSIMLDNSYFDENILIQKKKKINPPIFNVKEEYIPHTKLSSQSSKYTFSKYDPNLLPINNNPSQQNEKKNNKTFSIQKDFKIDQQNINENEFENKSNKQLANCSRDRDQLNNSMINTMNNNNMTNKIYNNQTNNPNSKQASQINNQTNNIKNLNSKDDYIEQSKQNQSLLYNSFNQDDNDFENNDFEVRENINPTNNTSNEEFEEQEMNLEFEENVQNRTFIAETPKKTEITKELDTQSTEQLQSKQDRQKEDINNTNDLNQEQIQEDKQTQMQNISNDLPQQSQQSNNDDDFEVQTSNQSEILTNNHNQESQQIFQNNDNCNNNNNNNSNNINNNNNNNGTNSPNESAIENESTQPSQSDHSHFTQISPQCDQTLIITSSSQSKIELIEEQIVEFISQDSRDLNSVLEKAYQLREQYGLTKKELTISQKWYNRFLEKYGIEFED